MNNKQLLSNSAFLRKCLAYVKHMLSMSCVVQAPTCHVSDTYRARIGQPTVEPLRTAGLFSGRFRDASETQTRLSQTIARVAREAIEAHRRVSGGQSRSKCAAQVRRANIELLKAELLKSAAVILFLFTVGIGNVWGDFVEFTPASSGGWTSTAGAQSGTKNNITLSTTRGAISTQLRSYSGETTTVSCASGYSISQIVFAYSNAAFSVASVGTWNSDTKTWTGNATSITFTQTGQVRMTSVTVTYSAGCTGTKLGTPVVTATPSDRQIVLSWPAVEHASSYQLKWNGGDWAAATSPVTKSTLTNGTAYTYQVKAIGNGSTYCDGDASAEASATPNNYHTVTWQTHNGVFATTQVVDGQKPTFPKVADADPTSCDTGEGASTAFYGWATSTWSGKATTLEDSKLSGITIYTSAASMPTVTTNDVVYYAVFCKGNGGSVTLTGSDFHDQLGSSYAECTITKTIGASNYTFNLNACEPNDTGNKCQMRDNSTISYIQIPSLPGIITRITATSFTNSSDAAYTGTLHFKSAKSRGNANTNDIARVTYSAPGITSLDWDLSSDNTTYTSGYFVTSAGLRMTDFTVYYGSAGTNYMTTCCTQLGTINGSVTLSQSGTSVTVKGWTYTQGGAAAESNISTYDVYLYSDADSYADPIQTQTCANNAKATGVTFTSLSYGTTYKIKIGATGNTNYCDITPIQVTTINSTSTQTFQLACDVPTNVAASSITASSATVSWDDVATNYQYVLDQSSSDPAGAGTAVNGAHSVDLSTLSPSTTYYFHVRTNCGNSVFSNWATISFNTPAAACSSYSFHDGTDGSNPSDWQINCFTYSGNSDRQWIKNFTIRNKSHYYVGYQGSFYNDNLGNNNAKSYTNQMQYMQLALDRGHNSNNQLGSNYAGVQGTLLCYDNSNSDNLFVDFLPDGYYFILDAAGTPTALPMTCTNADMTAANILSNNSVWETTIQKVTSVSYKYTVGIKADATIAGKAWQTTRYNTNEDMTTLKKRNSSGGFTGTLAAADVTAGTRGKYRIWADNFSTTAGEKNWYAHFVPYYHVTYNGNGATEGSTAASADVSCEGTVGQRTVQAATNGFTGPAHTTFGGWATSASGAKVYDPDDDIVLTADVELFAVWEPEANATITLNNYTGSAAPTNLYAGDSWNLPLTNTYTCGDKTFVGWSTVTITTPVDTKPSSNFYEPGASVTLAATNTFYAVFANGSDDADFELVTDASDLSVGDIVTIASVVGNSQSGSVIKAYASGNNWPKADVTTSATGTIAANTTDMQTFTLAEGTVSDTWAFYDGTGYIYAANTSGGSNNYMKRQTTLDAAGSFAITIADNTYEATMISQGDVNGRKDMRYNSSNNPPIFSCYASTSTLPKAYLYRQPAATGYSTTCVACETVTVAYTASPTGGTVGVKKGSADIAPNGTVNVCGSAVNLTVTLTAAEHYTATGLTAVLGSTPLSPTNVGNVYTVTLPADATTSTLTLTPTFTAETPLTITFDVSSVSGVTAGDIGTIYSGDDFDFPDVSGVPVGFCATFLGWVDFTNGTTFDGDGTTTTEPAELIEVGDNSGVVTTNKVYKAVYGESEDEEVEAYSKVTSSLDDWSGNYLIVHESSGRALDGNLGTSNIDAQSNYFSVTISAGKITGNHTAKQWTIAKIGETSTYTIKGASGCYIGRATTGNGLDKTTDAASADANTIAYSSGVTISGSGGPSLQYYSTSGQERFRYYGSSQQAISLFKLGTTTVTTYTYTTAPSCGVKYRVTVEDVTGGSPSVSPKYCADGTTVSLVANPATGYNFTSWTITKDGTNPLQDVTSTLLGANSTVASTSFSMPDYDVTITPAYAIINYNITYNNLNGATNSNPATYNVASADINFVAPGERSGYVFKGWYDDNVYTNAVTGIPNGSTGAVTVYAKWATGYTITWDNAIGSNPTSTGVEDGDPIGPLPTPTGSCSVDGTTYSNFVGWYTGTISEVASDPSDAGTLVTSATVPTASATYHAVYTNMPDYSGTNTSNVTLPEVATPKENVKVKVDDADDAPEYDGIKIGTSSTKTSSFTFTVPAGTTKITMQGVAWSGKTASVALSTSVGTISPNTAQSLDDNSGASDRSPFTITSYTTLTFNLSNVNSEATITVANSGERVIVWGINAASASGDNVGYITQCCDNLMDAPTMNSPTVRTSTAITLSWQTVTNATGYKVSWNGGEWEDVGTATTYSKTSLEPGQDYSYKVIAKYPTPAYCGASAREGVVSTKPVYSVTYAKGSGTGSCTPSGSAPAVAYYEEGATVNLAATNTFSLFGNTFAAWSSEQVALTVESTTFTMPAEDVIVTATWTAKQDKYYDNMHNLTATDPVTGDPGTADGAHYYIVREGCNYTVPSLSNNSTGDTECHTTHYVLMGWAAAGHIHQTGDNAGQVISGHESYVFTGGGEKSATGATYYAVWAIVTTE